MSKGLSKQQLTILGLLNGSVKPQCFSSGGELTTGELVEELVAHGILRDSMPHKQQLSTVRRACDSLVRRGLVAGRYAIHLDYPWAYEITWSVKQVGDDDQPTNDKGEMNEDAD